MMGLGFVVIGGERVLEVGRGFWGFVSFCFWGFI